MKNERVDIVLTADDNYVKQLCVTMCSILCNTKKSENFTFHIFCHNFGEKDYLRVKNLCAKYGCETLFYDMSGYISLFDASDISTFANSYINISCYFRLLLLKILPEIVEDCYYIDCDIIVNTDLYRLQKRAEGYSFATVMESLAMHNADTILKHLQGIEEFERFRKEPNQYSYFNAGFFWIDLVWARSEKLWERAMFFFHRYPTLPYADQDILNYTIGQKENTNIYWLGPEYNVFTDYDIKLSYLSNERYTNWKIKKAYLIPKVIHYAGANKPWLEKKCRFYKKWWKYAKKEEII